MIRFSFARLLLAAMLFATGPALAQNTVPNPLRGSAQDRTPTDTPAPGAAAKADTKAAAATGKPPRERSAKQRQNDDDMRACGASWRAEKDSLAAKGTTWRAYLKDCRATKKMGRDKV